MFLYTLLFASAALFAIWHGLAFKDATTKGFGLAFLGINLYTQFFTNCWDLLYKPIFFAVVAISFGVIGRYAEAIWNVKMEGRCVFTRVPKSLYAA